MRTSVAALLLAVVLVVLAAADARKKGDKRKMMMKSKLKMKMKKLMDMPVEYFVVESEDDDCGSVPEETMKGMPMMDGCEDLEEGEERCVCIKKPEKMYDMMEELKMDMSMVNEDTGFANMCGVCKDPCSLKWMPKMNMDKMEDDSEGNTNKAFN